jgi:ATP-dependent helicase HrpA
LARPLNYPPELPVSARRAEIVAAIAANQVVVVAGETGSGKSTQLPKICLEAGRGRAGMIGHTQPRRIAARAVAERLAEELGVAVGGPVGYKVRFTERVSARTVVKLMTDGVLLAELAGDRLLQAYDTLIVDEAHERSLNIDFVLGYLALLLPSRPDLKVVVTSATLDTESFSRHFGEAPVIEVSGRSYPVEIRYRPAGGGPAGEPTSGESRAGSPSELAGRHAFGNSSSRGPGRSGPSRAGGASAGDVVQAVCDAVGELYAEGSGDILVFLAGEAEIGDVADALASSGPPGLEIIPLYGRLSSAEQRRVFEPHSGRRAVLATNVAETSLTVPGVRYVIDAGTARMSRYSRRTKVQRLPIEPISQASADQRAGRCGRLGPGICVRLYSEDDYKARPRFTDPEILRTNLASVVLQMAVIGLPDVERFPFIDPPDRRNVKDGVALLEELGALVADDGARRLTPLGRKLARLPLDPRLGRMVLEGARRGCLRELLVIASALAVQDPRERPAARQQDADRLHKRFEDTSSDFFSYLALWEYLAANKAEMSGTQFRLMCQRELISYQRVREWQDVHAELVDICAEIGLRPTLGEGPSRRSDVHRAVLSGLLTQVGARQGERKEFAAPRGARFCIWPGSVLAKRPPRWVMAAELVETSRLWGRVCAPVKAQWVERAASELLEWSFSEPLWDPAAGEAYLVARATLFGLPVVPGRRRELARLGRDRLAREMFIRSALVEGDWEAAPGFVARNAELLAGLAQAAERERRLGAAPGREELFAFYDARVPAQVVSGRTFESWWGGGRRELDATPADLGATGLTGGGGFPSTWPGASDLAVSYEWGGAGVSVDVPLARFADVAHELEWQVPGLRQDLVEALLRSLPKHLRRELAPVRERARAFVAEAGPADGLLLVVLARSMSEVAGADVRPADFDWSKVPDHLRAQVRVTGERGEVLAAGKDLGKLAADLRPLRERALAEAASSPRLGWGPAGRRSVRWEFGTLPQRFEADWHGQRLAGFPALADKTDEVEVVVLAEEASQREAMQAGVRRLVLLNIGQHQLASKLERTLDNRTKLAIGALAAFGYRTGRELAEDVVSAALNEVMARHDLPFDEAGFTCLVQRARGECPALSAQVMPAVSRIVSRLYELQGKLRSMPAYPSLEDARAHFARLGARCFVSRAGLGRLGDIERYVAGLEYRLGKLPANPSRDLQLSEKVQALEQLVSELPAPRREELRWLLEELRVSYFAQPVGTKVPVSEQRVLRALAEAR